MKAAVPMKEDILLKDDVKGDRIETPGGSW